MFDLERDASVLELDVKLCEQCSELNAMVIQVFQSVLTESKVTHAPISRDSFILIR